MKILGISAHYHDSAAALLVDGVPICSVQEERLSRRKGDSDFPMAAIEWCLERGGLDPEQLDAVVFYEKPFLKFERILTLALRNFPHTWRTFPRAMKNSLGGKLWVKAIINSSLGVPLKKVFFTEHHQSHAAAAFFTSPTKSAALFTTDGVGEWATMTVGRGSRQKGEVKIELYDAHHEKVADWTLKNAMPKKWKISGFEAGGNQVAVESLEIEHNGFLEDEVKG